MTSEAQPTRSAWPVLWVFLRLGLTSFGGPVAHLGYFREEFVQRRRWLDERSYADLVALCQFLPGPASSQVGMGLGLLRAGFPGALAAWLGFTLPSALLLAALALGLQAGGAVPAGVLHGLKVVAVAVVAQALWGMARTLCVGPARVTLMVAAACAALLWPGVAVQLAVLALAALWGWYRFRAEVALPSAGSAHSAVWDLPVRRRTGALLCGVFVLLCLCLPVLARQAPGTVWPVIDAFYRAGALVFGGGHVVLPMLQTELVAPGWLSHDVFLAGYGAAQAVPGPLFTLAAFLGAALPGSLGGGWGALWCVLAIFLPSFLLVAGVLPFWGALRQRVGVQAALLGVNAAVVGVLLAAFYQPVWVSAITSSADVVLALLAWLALVFWRLPPWLVVLACAGVGWLAGIH